MKVILLPDDHEEDYDVDELTLASRANEAEAKLRAEERRDYDY